MWIMLNDAFLSIVKKDCPEDHLLVRARRPGDIEKVFGRLFAVERLTDADYLFRAVIPVDDVMHAMNREIGRINYRNFKDSVRDDDLHRAYNRCWGAVAAVQNPPPYSERFRGFVSDKYHEMPESEVADLFLPPKPTKPAKPAKKGKR